MAESYHSNRMPCELGCMGQNIIGARIPFEDCVELSDFNVSMNFMLRCSSIIKCVNISNNIEMKFFVLQRQSLPRF